jgi:hypothetical protein
LLDWTGQGTARRALKIAEFFQRDGGMSVAANVKIWRENRLYEQIQKSRKDRQLLSCTMDRPLLMVLRNRERA